MTIDTTATSTAAGVMTIGSTAPIKVKVSTACPRAAAGNLTHTAGIITGITNGTTNFGTWTQVPGAISRLVVQLPGQSVLSATTCAIPAGTPSTQTLNSQFSTTLYAMDQAYNLGAPNNYADSVRTLAYSVSGQSNTNVSASFSGGTATAGVTVINSGNYTLTFTDGGSYGLASASFDVIGGRRLIDSISPSSSLISPVEGEKIEAGKPYVIIGASIDLGTVSVRQAEVSVDGGLSWSLATPVTFTQNGFNWKYEWLNPKVGLYSIQVRGTDGYNVEIPKSGVMVSVAVPAPITVAPKTAPDVVAPEQPKKEPAASKSETVTETATEMPKLSVVLIRAEGDQMVYVVRNNLKRHIPSAEVFNSYGYSWQDVKAVAPVAVSAYRTVNLVRQAGDDKVYAIENGKKRWIATPEEFASAGYDWNEVMEINAAEFGFYLERGAVKNARIIVNVLNVRDLPSLSGKILTTVTQNSAYPIIAETESWIKIKLLSGLEGWVFAQYAER